MTFDDRFTNNWLSDLECPWGPYRGLVTEVHDGDTLTVLLDPGFGDRPEEKIRLYGVNSPELFRGTPEDRAKGIAARDYVRSRLADFTPVRVHTLAAKSGETKTFVRYVASIEFIAAGVIVDLAADLVAHGHAIWCDRNLKPLPGPPPPIRRWLPPAK